MEFIEEKNRIMLKSQQRPFYLLIILAAVGVQWTRPMALVTKPPRRPRQPNRMLFI